MKRIVFITGHYGSGKTEVALNLAAQHQLDYLFDLDIINPYFRSRTFKGKLRHTTVIASDLVDDQYSDLPFISKKIFLPFIQKDRTAIYDLGGNDLGIKVMKQFSKEDMRDVDIYMVINVYRPETQHINDIITVIHRLEQQSGLNITGLMNNSNLLHETNINHIRDGYTIIKKVSKMTGIPLICSCVHESLSKDIDHLMGQKLMMKRFFDSDTHHL